ncbi:helix-turn-helix transcriptional regulator [Roseobacter sp. AzwK-3b]|uniref:helix-turn-helix domain-containing protein n=1 Tax=Roseobacter sp. AzwK-3b TaxID=351016 RepID=UPI0012F50E70
MSQKSIAGLQIRLARLALRWSVAELSERSKVSTSTIKRIEAQDDPPTSTQANSSALVNALESAGIEFIGSPDDRPGIRIGKPGPGNKTE